MRQTVVGHVAVFMSILRIGALLAVFALPGCGSFLTEGTADLAGVAGAGAATAVTKSAAGAAAIGLGVRSVAAEGLKYVTRRVHRDEQDAIAAAAGPVEAGGMARWSVSHRIPIEDDEHGEVTVTRVFGAGAVRCKEIVFSVETTRRQAVQRAFYLTSVCNAGGRWRWAAAEPATERWGALQ